MGCVLLGLATNTCTEKNQHQPKGENKTRGHVCRGQQSTCYTHPMLPWACGEARIINSEVFALEDLILQFKKGGELHVLAQKGLTYSLML